MWENHTFYFLCKGARLSQNNIKSYYNREWRTDWVSEWLSERQTISKRSFATKNIKLTFKICWPTKARYYTYVLLYTRLIISFSICNRNRTFWRFIMRRKKKLYLQHSNSTTSIFFQGYQPTQECNGYRVEIFNPIALIFCGVFSLLIGPLHADHSGSKQCKRVTTCTFL